MGNSVKLGETYRDTVSGFVGVATARAEYFHGATEVMISPQTGPSGDDDSRWIKEGRLVPHGSAQSPGFGAPR